MPWYQPISIIILINSLYTTVMLFKLTWHHKQTNKNNAAALRGQRRCFLKLEVHLEEAAGTGCTIPAAFHPRALSSWREGAKQTAFPFLPNGPGHRFCLARGRAPATDSAELKAEYRILFYASCLCSRLVWPRSHLNRWKESVLALARGLQWKPQRRLQTHWSRRAAEKEERRLRKF